MGKILIAVLVILAAQAAAAHVAIAQGITVTEDNLSIDQDQLRKEHEELMKALNDDPDMVAKKGLLRKTEYCLTCKSGIKASCTAPFGGETGKVWCASQCTYKCKSSCGVAASAC